MAEASSASNPNSVAPSVLLLTTKLYIPPARPGPVPRPRLTQRLNEGLARKLILLSAPAGFGKTTLLSEWRTTSPAKEMPFAWLSLDEGDNDPARFWAYVVAALQRIQPDMGAGIPAAFQSPQPPAPESVLPVLINELATLPSDFVLVLDDYHVIHHEAIHQAVSFLLEHLPPQAHLVLASRAEPLLPLSLLRGRGQLVELHADDLRFTLAEVTTFLNQVMGLALTPPQIAILEERTEGWIASLQMAALSMQGRKDPAAFIETFSGSHRHVADYLAEQVLEQQPEEVRSFLLQTAVLNRMCASLCEAVTNQSNGQMRLEQLEEANLFLIPLDDGRRWYRYHHLFAEVLRDRLRRAEPGRERELHRKAAAWYDQNGLLEEAVGHGLAAQDYDVVARQVEHAFDAMWHGGNRTVMLAWLRALPEAVIRARPWLCIGYAAVLSQAGELAAAEPWLAEAERLLQASPSSPDEVQADLQELWGEVVYARMHNAGLAGDTARVDALAQQAGGLFPDDVTWQYAVMAMTGAAHWLNLDAVSAERLLSEGIAHLSGTGNPQLRFFVFALILVQRERGRLQHAEQGGQQLLQLLPAEEPQRLVWAARAYRNLGLVHYEWDRRRTATQYCQELLAIGRQLDAAMLLAESYVWLAWLAQAEGDRARAADLAQQALQFEPRMRHDPINWGGLQAWAARLWLKQGDLEAAGRWAATLDIKVDTLTYIRRFEYLTLVRIFLAQGKVAEALDLLGRLWARAQVQEWDRVEILALQALAHQAHGDTGQAIAALRQALTLGEPEGFVRTFVDEGEPMAKLLRTAAAQGIAPAYMARLLAAIPRPAAPASSTTPALSEPLTRRELQILRWLAQDLSGPEIARELVVAESTVKSHLKRIYDKLAVHSRSEALERAHELGLL